MSDKPKNIRELICGRGSDDPELDALLALAAQARDDAENRGMLTAEPDDARVADELRARALGAGIPECPDLDLVLGGAIRESPALAGLRCAVRRGWAPGSEGDDKPWTLLSGNVGTGKSIAALWALTHGTCDERGLAPGGRRYLRSKRLARLNAAYAPDREQLDELASVRWLVLDDLGWQDAGRDEHLAPAVVDVLEERHLRRRPTILVTNLERRALAEYLGDRLVDRMRQVVTSVVTGDRSMRR
ncbi:hypothetical protein [Haliangium sp.]|uniref:hypothetical protein n=1 Tax=Haliangium sp. TaxID=2663208 RepID=UPI003D15308D